MRVFYSAEDIPALQNPVVTVGSYDGVHFGHRVLLDTVMERAAEEHGESVVVTFWPHPRQVLPNGGDIKLLNTLQEKLFLLEEAGIDNVVVLPFTTEFSGMTAYEFLSRVLVGRIGMRHFVVGYNHRFGSDRKGDIETLRAWQPEFGFVAECVERHDVHDEKVSSTIIRNLIGHGEMTKAAEFLTRGYILISDTDNTGTVLSVCKDKLLPPQGRYPVKVRNGEFVSEDTVEIDDTGIVKLVKGSDGAVKDLLVTFL